MIDKGNASHPFNTSFGDLLEEAGQNACHLNIDRIAWVAQRIKEAETDVSED